MFIGKKKTVKKGFAKLTKAERIIISTKGGYARHGLRQTPSGKVVKI